MTAKLPRHGPIGVFDSGVGGLTVFRALERALPDESLLYLGDTARVPYGIKSAETVVRYSREAAHFMHRHGVRMLVVACNTVSAVALHALQDEGFPVLGVIGPGARRAVERSPSGKIGVIGTRATVGSSAYTRSIHELAPRAQVVARACPLFVPLAEEGWTDNDVARQVAREYLRPMREAGIDTLVLGCTHYPLLAEVIAEAVGPQVALVDSAEAVAQEVAQHIEERGDRTPPSALPVEHKFFVTDAPEPFQAVAERFLGRSITRLERTHIEGA